MKSANIILIDVNRNGTWSCIDDLDFMVSALGSHISNVFKSTDAHRVHFDIAKYIKMMQVTALIYIQVVQIASWHQYRGQLTAWCDVQGSQWIVPSNEMCDVGDVNCINVRYPVVTDVKQFQIRIDANQVYCFEILM